MCSNRNSAFHIKPLPVIRSHMFKAAWCINLDLYAPWFESTSVLICIVVYESKRSQKLLNHKLYSDSNPCLGC
jgi:hypothetical protein